MKTSTLHQLVDSLTDARHNHLASALFESDPERQSRERDQAGRIGAVLDAIRSELSARDARDGRTTKAAQRADRYIQRLLADFLDLGGLDEVSRIARPAPFPINPGPHTGIVFPSIAGPDMESDQKHTNGIRQRRQAKERIG